jgi:hypothetical protein
MPIHIICKATINATKVSCVSVKQHLHTTFVFVWRYGDGNTSDIQEEREKNVRKRNIGKTLF